MNYPADMSAQTRLRAWLILVFTALVLLFVGMGIWRFYHTGKIVVTSDSSNSITITSLKDPGHALNKPHSWHGTGKLSVVVPFGNYAIRVKDRTVSIEQTAALLSHKTLRYDLRPAVAAVPEPVASIKASFLSVGVDRLSYLDSQGQLPSFITTTGSIAQIGQTPLGSVKWADSNYGVGQDAAGRLYVIDGDTLADLATPEVPGSSNPVSYSIAPDRQIYLAFGTRIYAGNPSGGFKKIYTAALAPTELAASRQRVALVYSPANGSSSKPFITLVGTSGKFVKTLSGEAGLVSWSPDGSRLAVADYDGGASVFDNNLGFVQELSTDNISQLAWLNNDVLLYGVANLLWSHDVRSGRSTVIATLTPDRTIREVVPDTTRSYAYLTSDTPAGGEIDRVGLKGQSAPAFVYKLAVFLPVSLDQCLVGFTNFSQPTIVLSPFSQVTAGGCEQAARSNLQDDQIDTSKLNFFIGPVVTSVD